MKKIAVLLFPALLLAFSGCIIDEWDGQTLDGKQYYELNVEQIGTILRVVVTVDETEYQEAMEKDNYSVPDELFLWMSPTFKAGYYSYGNSPMYPAARQKIQTGQLFDEDGNALAGKSVNIDIDLAKMAWDWNISWLSEGNFDGDADWAEVDVGDDMNGCYVFLSDGYSYYENYDYDDAYYYSVEGGVVETYRGFAGTNMDFEFYRNRPSGNGYSNVREYPETGSDEIWTAFTLLGEGMYVSSGEVLGGEPVNITLQIGESWSFSGFVEIYGEWGEYFTLDLSNTNPFAPDASDTTIIWDVVFHYPGSPDIPVLDGNGLDSNGFFHVEAIKEQYFHLQWTDGWQGSSFYYMGDAQLLLATDFDGTNINMTGNIGSGIEDLVPSTEHDWTFDYISYDFVPDNTYNNWMTGMPDSGFCPADGDPGNVLGLGVTSVDDFYQQNRNDILTFPEFYYEVTSYEAITIAFDAYRDLDWNWYDIVSVEYYYDDNIYDEWDGSWYLIDSFGGSMEYWEQQDNNGWRLNTFQYWPSTGTQKIRFRFLSNDWEENVGIFIDNIKVLTLR